MSNSPNNEAQNWSSALLTVAGTQQQDALPMTGNKSEESRLRRLAKKKGYRICKSRDRSTHTNNRGGYQLIVEVKNTVVAGLDFDLSLSDAEAFLSSKPKENQ